MTPEKAIEAIKIEKISIEGNAERVAEFFEGLSVAKTALEKQMPKKPKKETWVDDEKHKGDVRLAGENDILTKGNHTIINYCPNCGEGLTVAKYLSPPKYDLYCKQCGQAIDWSDTE